MKKWIYIVTSLAVLAFLAAACAKTNPDFAASQKTIENWFAAMKGDKFDQAGEYLSPEFVSIHTDGMVRNKSQELELIKKLHMQNYKLSHFKFAQSGDAIVVTYKDETAETIDNKPVSAQQAGRMAVLQKQDDKWLILAYANMDKIG